MSAFHKSLLNSKTAFFIMARQGPLGYLIVLFFIPRHVIINITASAFNSKNSISDCRYHIQLLDYRIHITCSTSIFQPNKALWRSWSNWGKIFPFCKCFTTYMVEKRSIVYKILKLIITNNFESHLTYYCHITKLIYLNSMYYPANIKIRFLYLPYNLFLVNTLSVTEDSGYRLLPLRGDTKQNKSLSPCHIG